MEIIIKEAYNGYILTYYADDGEIDIDVVKYSMTEVLRVINKWLNETPAMINDCPLPE